MTAPRTKVPKWRERRSVLSNETREAYARAFGCELTVTVYRDSRTVGRVERKRSSDGGYDTIGRREWSRCTDSFLLRARDWCEITAERTAKEKKQ